MNYKKGEDMSKPNVMHFDFRQLEWIPPTQEDLNDELDRYSEDDVCVIL